MFGGINANRGLETLWYFQRQWSILGTSFEFSSGPLDSVQIDRQWTILSAQPKVSSAPLYGDRAVLNLRPNLPADFVESHRTVRAASIDAS
jgi:hypothetical protein